MTERTGYMQHPLTVDNHRFWIKVNMDGPTQDHMDTNCWLWIAGTSDKYGVWNLPNYGPMVYAHRYAWELLSKASILSGFEVDHLCFEQLCVRPDHLEVVTHAENVKRHHARTTECPRGHEYTEENTALRACQGYQVRVCRTCAREREATCRREMKVLENV